MTARGMDFTGIAYLVVLAAAGYAVYRVAKGAPTVADAVKRVTESVVTAVNPTDPNNLANRAANAITAALTGDPSMTPGLWLENQFKPKPRDGNQLLSQFSGLDQEDADAGAAIRRLQLRGESVAWSAADQDDADLGRAMASASGAAFMDFNKLRRGAIR